jgi:dipeptidyl aminopeptidase/acylaminoacyl peptidase
LAYARLGTEADIWRFSPGGQPENFLSSTLDDRNPQFSPDGKKIVFESRRLGKDSQLWIANSDGTSPRPLLEGVKGISGSPRWSSDGRFIVFDGQDQNGQLAVQVVDAEGGLPRVVTKQGYVPSWSRDGKWIYFGSQRTGRGEVWRVPAAGGEPIQITDEGGSFASESADGKTLYYRRGTALMARPVAGGATRQVLDSLPSLGHQYFPVEDGIYYVARPDPSFPFAFELRFMNSTTGKQTTLSRFAARSGQGLGVSPDRKTILYSGTKPSDGSDLVLIGNFR